MRPYLLRIFRHLKRRASWALPVELFLFVFFSSWLLMIWAEPPGSNLVDANFYWWWFAGTITPAAAGTGEHSPMTTEGQMVGIYVIVGGIVTITTLFARLAQMIGNAKGLRMKGLQSLRLTRHIVLLGYSLGRTEEIIEALDAEEPADIVVCAWDDQASEHPLSHREHVHFVRGNLTDDDVLRRAAVPAAMAVLVDARDDDEALKVTVAVNYLNPEVHTVVALQDLAHTRTFSRVAENASCVHWHARELITEELRDAGIARVYREMMTYSDRNTYSIRVPAELPGRTFGEFQQALGRWNAATILAVGTGSELYLSPSWDAEVPVGATLFYIGRRRLHAKDLAQLIDRAERALVFSDRELARGEWHGDAGR